MSHVGALTQADLDYQKADIDQKIQQHVAAYQGHSAELDSAFIMGLKLVCPFLPVYLFKS